VEEGQLGIGEELHAALVDCTVPERIEYWSIKEPKRLILWIDKDGKILHSQCIEYNG
jgi:hypothetical protein